MSGNTVAFRSKGRDRGAVEAHQLAGVCSARRLVSFLSLLLRVSFFLSFSPFFFVYFYFSLLILHLFFPPSSTLAGKLLWAKEKQRVCL